MEAPLLTVGNSTAGVESLLGDGLLSCPGCGGRLGGHGHAVRRRVFTAGRLAVSVCPRRARCSSCGTTHVLLPAWLLARRIVFKLSEGDTVERGQRVGLIKFGSRVDVILPAEAALKVKVGQKVKGGESVLAAMPGGAGA